MRTPFFCAKGKWPFGASVTYPSLETMNEFWSLLVRVIVSLLMLGIEIK